MDFNKAFFLKKEDRKPRWIVIDAKGKILGRMATKIADILRGKDKPTYTPNQDGGDYVIVINAKEVKFTGDKLEGKIYDRYTGWMGGYKTITAGKLLEKNPEQVVELAVKRMLPKSKLGRAVFKKLKVYPTAEHPHRAQVA
ncbi:MAG: 50S ribosomal protein L13 [Candidatus Babeliales bacterium]